MHATESPARFAKVKRAYQLVKAKLQRQPTNLKAAYLARTKQLFGGLNARDPELASALADVVAPIREAYSVHDLATATAGWTLSDKSPEKAQSLLRSAVVRAHSYLKRITKGKQGHVVRIRVRDLQLKPRAKLLREIVETAEALDYPVFVLSTPAKAVSELERGMTRLQTTRALADQYLGDWTAHAYFEPGREGVYLTRVPYVNAETTAFHEIAHVHNFARWDHKWLLGHFLKNVHRPNRITRNLHKGGIVGFVHVIARARHWKKALREKGLADVVEMGELAGMSALDWNVYMNWRSMLDEVAVRENARDYSREIGTPSAFSVTELKDWNSIQGQYKDRYTRAIKTPLTLESARNIVRELNKRLLPIPTRAGPNHGAAIERFLNKVVEE